MNDFTKDELVKLSMIITAYCTNTSVSSGIFPDDVILVNKLEAIMDNYKEPFDTITIPKKEYDELKEISWMYKEIQDCLPFSCNPKMGFANKLFDKVQSMIDNYASQAKEMCEHETGPIAPTMLAKDIVCIKCGEFYLSKYLSDGVCLGLRKCPECNSNLADYSGKCGDIWRTPCSNSNCSYVHETCVQNYARLKLK